MLLTVRKPLALTGFALAVVAGYLVWPGPVIDPSPPPSPAGPTIEWTFDAPDAGGFLATPWVEDDAVYVSAVLTRGLTQRGVVYAVDPSAGKRLWTFNADGGMRPVASAPVRAGGRVFVGEGMHADFVCRLFALDAGTGRPAWHLTANDHVEAAPTVVGETVYASAGNAGVYAADAATGTVKWHFERDLHIDTRPAVADGRVIVGSGPSRRFRTLAVVALSETDGKLLWQTPVDLPAWGSPNVSGGRVFVGLGNGRLTEPARPPATPAGACVCLDAATGHEIWRIRTPDAVFQRPTNDAETVYFGCRDGTVTRAAAADGTVTWRTDLGGPVIASVALDNDRLFAVTQTGMLALLDAGTGAVGWRFDLKSHTQAEPLCVAAPVVRAGRLYLATEIDTPAGRVASLYCFRLPNE